MNLSRRQHGYALLVTLLLLTIAAVAMAAVGRQSLDQALVALRAEQDLQQRWTTLTSRSVLLPLAEKAISNAEVQREQTLGSVTIKTRLNDTDYAFVFTDEQAKANVNALQRYRGRDQLVYVLRRLIPAGSAGLTKVRLRPVLQQPPARSSALKTPARELSLLGSYAQVFERALPEYLVGQRPRASIAAHLTCWGNGQLNVRRASRPALQEICTPLLGLQEVDQLIAIRQESPDFNLTDVLDRLNLTHHQRQELAGRLTDRASCHGLWIVTNNKKQSRFQLSVVEGSRRGGALLRTFTW